VSSTPPSERREAPADVERLYDASADRAGYVRRIFGEIAGRYDLMNTIMTGGRHHAWRSATARALVRPGDRVVDVGCGTGDLSLACARAGAGTVLGVDFAAPMLPIARRKAARQGARAARVGFTQGDGLRLPLEDASADAWCAAFVMRNVPDVDGLLAEAHRVLRPGGRLAVLDIPRIEGGLLAPFKRFHLARVVPLLGRLFGGHSDAYSYLPVSAAHFMSVDELSARLAASGFEVERVHTFGVGTVALHLAVRKG
jgi:demethylmenaquinone methyltransferase/2-methoxy-6-polyprenyl-1,4-benzoquinol methylase